MKKLFFTLLICIFSNNITLSQDYNWITPNQTYLKMYIAEDGMYRLNKTDFTNAGIDANSIDPRTVKVYTRGNQIPVYFSGESDGNFGPADYLDFYGTRNRGGMTTTYDHNNNFVYSTNEYYDQYSDTNIFWIGWGGANGLRYANSNYNTSIVHPNLSFDETLHFEKDVFFSQGEILTAGDLRILSTEKFRGEGWYWSALFDNQELTDTFSLPNLNTVPQTASVRVFAYPSNRSTSIFNEHTLQIRVNGNLVSTLYSNDMNRIDSTVTFSSSLLSNFSVNTVSIKYVPVTGYSGYMYVDLFEVKYPRLFKLNSSKLSSSPAGADTTSKLFKVLGFNSASPVNIYDVNNNFRISNFTFNLDTLKFTSKGNSGLQIVNGNITLKPIRIKQKTVPDLVSSSNGADYLIIYHDLFLSQAEQLRSYRQTKDGFRSFKADVEDIYDIFNFGIESPVAIRNFTTHVYNNWQLPKLGYICLLGRASLDPKKNLPSSEFSRNLIPTYGSPPSDGYFANFNIGTFCYYHQIPIGRLPAYVPSEAQTMVDKIIAYENESPASWSKDFIFITGGSTPSEQISHQSKSNFDINVYITPPSISGDAHKIYRSDTSGVLSYNIKDSVTKDISRGALYVNFRGHAGSHDWEVVFTDPSTLSNGNKLPLVVSLTCFTGENALAYYRGFGERFVYLENKGAIGFVGTTGWSYSEYGNNFGTHMLQTMKTDTTRRVGKLVRYAQTQMSRDSIAFSIRHTLNCYSLIGDPAVKLNFPVRPELSISNEDYKLSNSFPNTGENITLSVYPKNFGTHCDSTKIRFQLNKDNSLYSFKDSVIRNFKMEDTLNFNFRIDSVGLFRAIVTLDVNNWIPLENKSNNVLNINIPVKNTAFVPLKPVNNSIVFTDSVEFSVLNPRVLSGTNVLKTILQFDTTQKFNSPLLKTFANKDISGVVSKFKTAVPAPANNKIYYWRTNCIINNDSSGWSGIQNFIYSNTLTSSPEASSRPIENDISKSEVIILKNNKNQYSPSDLYNAGFKANGVELSEFTSEMYVRSLGNNAEESSYFSVGDKNVYIDGGKNGGLNFLKVKKVNGSILTFKNLRMTTAASSDSIVSFLNTFDTTHYLMLLNASYVAGGTVLNAAAKTKLRQFGSIYCDSIHFLGYFHTWSLIGWLGANNSQVSESFHRCCDGAFNCTGCIRWIESISAKNALFKKTGGAVESIIGPAKSWQNFSWEQTLNPNSSIKFDVYGIDANNLQTLLLSDMQNNNLSDLSSIDALQYPKLRMIAKLNIDTAVGTLSPVLNSVRVNYIAPSELTWNVNSLVLASTFIVGEDLKYNFDYHNVGYSNVPGLIFNVFQKNIYEQNLIRSDTVSEQLSVEAFSNYKNKISVPYFRDSMKIIIQVKPKDFSHEFFTYNNNIEFTMNSVNVNRNATVQVYSDNRLLINGDYVTKNPEIKITISDPDFNSSLISDTTKLKLSLNDRYVPYYNKGGANSSVRTFRSDKSSTGGEEIILYYPEMSDGKNRLTLIYASEGGETDSIFYDVFVSDEFSVKDLYNYPNPMKDATSFVFNITGSYAPTKFKIKIYTVSGRLIKQIESAVTIGNNQIQWDGRDDDGDILANGTYLYKLVTEDEGQSFTQTQKLVVLR